MSKLSEVWGNWTTWTSGNNDFSTSRNCGSATVSSEQAPGNLHDQHKWDIYQNVYGNRGTSMVC